jgi:hypothetical protein
MGFQIRQTRPANLRDAMEAAHNYENSAQSLRKAVRRSEKQEKGKGNVAIHDRVFPYYAPNSSIKHSKSDSKDRSQEIL